MRLVAVVVAAALAALAGASVARADVVVTVPADIVAEAQGPAGAQVTYEASAKEDESATDLPISCTNPDGSTSDGTGTIQPTVLFPLGATTVTCSTTTGESASFTVTVQDTTPPVVTPPAPVTAEATGPSGAVVSYGAASASDLVDGSVAATCAPATGSAFPLGSTTVTCSATDSAGNTGTATTSVLVHDTTPPVVTPPMDITVSAPASVGSLGPTDPTIAAFLAGATATDTVDPSPTITVAGPTSYPVGTTRRVTFTATDDSGNSASATATVTVVASTGGTPPPPPPPPPGPPPPPSPPPPPPAQRDRTPPAEASGFKAKAGDHRVVVTWSLPKDADFDHVVLVRSTTRGKQVQKVVYTGRGRSYTDRKLSNNVTFRYTLSTVDRAGNRSDGVSTTARPHTIYLVKPADGARIRKPPTLLWIPKTKAFYYNVQLYRGSTKVLSAWPSQNKFVLRSTWKYHGHRYRLRPGAYRWYVWPGIGPRRYAKYGKLLGQNTFTYAPSV
jgi:HYR domain